MLGAKLITVELVVPVCSAVAGNGFNIVESFESGITASASPASAIVANVGFVAIPPSASCGIFGNSTPNFCPPMLGTQSGTENCIPLTESIIELIIAMIVLTGAFTIPTSDSNVPEKTALIDSIATVHALEIFSETAEANSFNLSQFL